MLMSVPVIALAMVLVVGRFAAGVTPVAPGVLARRPPGGVARAGGVTAAAIAGGVVDAIMRPRGKKGRGGMELLSQSNPGGSNRLRYHKKSLSAVLFSKRT